MYGLHSKKHVLLVNVGGKVFLRQITKNRLFSFHKKHKNTKNVFMRYCIFCLHVQCNTISTPFVSCQTFFNTSFYDYTPIPQNYLIDSNIWCRKEWITLRIHYVIHQITVFLQNLYLLLSFSYITSCIQDMTKIAISFIVLYRKNETGFAIHVHLIPYKFWGEIS